MKISMLSQKVEAIRRVGGNIIIVIVRDAAAKPGVEGRVVLLGSIIDAGCGTGRRRKVSSTETKHESLRKMSWTKHESDTSRP